MRRPLPVVRALLWLGALYLFFEFGIGPLTGVVTGRAAPLPTSLVTLYTAMAAAGILLYASVREEGWREFVRPVVRFLGPPAALGPGQRLLRRSLLVLLPLALGTRAYYNEAHRPPPADPPGIHFDLPDQYIRAANPLPWTPENIREGGVLYTRNCAMCHGDAQDGDGLFARAWQPKPANFRDQNTIAQLGENYLFWRIKEGGPGIPPGGIGYRSAMPVWGGVLTDDEIWKIIMFEYTNAGQKPAKRDK